jgi:hypothetical protein
VAKMNIQQYLPFVIQYLQKVNLNSIPGWDQIEHFTVHPVAQGEYNMNYLVHKAGKTWVFRGRSWSAMAWVTYQTEDHTLKNQDTYEDFI